MTAGSGALRRRRRPSLTTRLRILWVFLVLIFAAVAYGGYVLVTLPALRVHEIRVRIDGLEVNESQVLAAADVDRTGNLWLLNTAHIAQRIEAIPYVDRATVRRIPPSTLTIAVSEREPAACVRSGTREVTIDDSRRILQDGCGRESAVRINLPDFAMSRPGTQAGAPALPALLTDSRALRAANLDIRALEQDRFGQLVAVDRAGIRLLFGADADIVDKARLVGPVLAAAGPGRSVQAVDLRAPATPTLEFR